MTQRDTGQLDYSHSNSITMSGPAVEGLVLEGELSALTPQLTKVKSVKTKKINTLKKTIERFDVDQNNIISNQIQLN